MVLHLNEVWNGIISTKNALFQETGQVLLKIFICVDILSLIHNFLFLKKAVALYFK